MGIKQIAVAVIFLIGLQVQAQDLGVFEEANTLYLSREYQSALSTYEELESQGWQSAELYYNIGNCHYELGHLGESILYYEKAMLLDSDDEDIIHNLKVANRKTVDRIEELPRPIFRRIIHSISSIFSADTWAVLFVIILFLGFGLLILYVRERSRLKRVFIIIGMIFLGLSVVVLSLMFVEKEQESRSFGIVLELNAYVKDGPGDNSDDLFILHEGTKAEILDDYQSWYKISLIDGKIGWLDSALMEEI